MRYIIFLRNSAMSRRVMHSDGISKFFFRQTLRSVRFPWQADSDLFEKQYSGLSPLWRSTRRRRRRGWARGTSVGGAPGKGEGTRGALFLKFAWGIKARWLRSPAELLFADTECGGSKALCQAYVSLPFGNEWWEGREGSRERERGNRQKRKRKRRTKRQFEIERRDSPPTFGVHLEKLSYDSQL